MRIGLFFGSFNPIHHGHLIIASYAAQYTTLSEVWLVVSPQNPFKKSNQLLNENHRLHMARLAVEGSDKIKVSNIEFKLPKPSFTIDTIQYLKEKYPSYEFTIIMGSDGYQNIDQWKNAALLKKEVDFLVYERIGFEMNRSNKEMNVELLEGPFLTISSTLIRKMIKEGKSIQYLVPDIIVEDINSNNYYR